MVIQVGGATIVDHMQGRAALGREIDRSGTGWTGAQVWHDAGHEEELRLFDQGALLELIESGKVAIGSPEDRCAVAMIGG